MAEHLAPVDETIVVPASVKRAAEAADQIHKQIYTPDIQPANQPAENTPATPETPVDAMPSAPAEPAKPADIQADVVTAPVMPEVQPDQWQHRYNSMKGRYDQAMQTINGMQGQMQDMGNELMRLTSLINNQPQQRKPVPIPEEVRKAYGDELAQAIAETARTAVAPELSAMEQENRRLQQALITQQQKGVYERLADAVPGWEQVNEDQRFKDWLRLRDIYSGEIRHEMLMRALQAADAPRVIAFFKGFLQEEQATGQLAPMPSAPQQRTAAVPLETLTAPGRVRTATGEGTSVPVDKPIYTRDQIRWFYSHEGRQTYVGRDEDRRRDEAALFAAQREGRVR